MDEGRDSAPDTGSGTAPPRQIRAGLSPVQAAYAKFTNHFMDCDHCRDVDRGLCGEGAELQQAYQAADRHAQRRLARETP